MSLRPDLVTRIQEPLPLLLTAATRHDPDTEVLALESSDGETWSECARSGAGWVVTRPLIGWLTRPAM